MKYQNVLKELEYQQKQEVMKFEKNAKLKTMQKKTKFGLLSASKVSLSWQCYASKIILFLFSNINFN